MKKLKNLFLFTMTISCLVFSNCEAVDSSPACNTDLEYDSYLGALNSFSSNPTRTTCNNLKSKANAFITAAGKCGGIDVSGPKATINSIDCTDF